MFHQSAGAALTFDVCTSAGGCWDRPRISDPGGLVRVGLSMHMYPGTKVQIDNRESRSNKRLSSKNYICRRCSRYPLLKQRPLVRENRSLNMHALSLSLHICACNLQAGNKAREHSPILPLPHQSLSVTSWEGGLLVELLTQSEVGSDVL